MPQSDAPFPAWLDQVVLETALGLCVESYDPEVKIEKPVPNVLLKQRIEIRESVFNGTILGRLYLAEDTAYVVFRGTDITFSNLFVTNLQAVTCRHLVLDDDLVGASGVTHQGGEFQQVLPGEVHQGFARAASRLWYGSDLLISPFVGEESEAADFDGVFTRRRWRHAALLLFGGVAGFLAAHRSCLGMGWVLTITVLSAMFATLSMAAWESGFLESLVRIRPVPFEGSVALNKGRDDLASKKRVIFVGHSLGGSIAALCFSIYRKLYSQLKESQEVRLLTVGAPRVGSQAWVAAFESEHRGHHFHFVHDRDWVPHVPPASRVRDQFTRLARCGPVGLGILIVNPAWRWLYELHWRPEPYADLSPDSNSVCTLESPKGWISMWGNHRMSEYKTSILELAKRVRSSLPPERGP